MQLLSLREQCCACRGYILGGMLWFAVPFSMATTIGLAGLALDLPMSASEIGQALVPPAVAYHLLGKVRCMRSTPCVITDPFLSLARGASSHHVQQCILPPAQSPPSAMLHGFVGERMFRNRC